MSDEAAVKAAAEVYCEGLHVSDPSLFEAICHDAFLMSFVDSKGAGACARQSGVSRAGRRAQSVPGEASYEIETVDVAGPEIAHVRLWVDVPPRRFTDYLGFIQIGGKCN